MILFGLMLGLFGNGTMNISYAQQKLDDQLGGIKSEIQKARSANSKLENKANSLQAELSKMRSELIKVANDLQSQESLASRLETQLAALEGDLTKRQDEIYKRHSQISNAINLFAKHQEVSLPALLMQEGEPKDILQGVVLTAVMLPQISNRTRLLGQDLKALDNVGGDIQQKIAALEQSEKKLSLGKATLENLVQQNQALYQQTNSERKIAQDRIKKLVDKSKSIQELVAGIEASRKLVGNNNLNAKPNLPPATPEALVNKNIQNESDQADQADQALALVPQEANNNREAISLLRPQGIRAFPSIGNKISSPVSGKLVGRYGDELKIGGKSRGVQLLARPEAQVVASYDGKIVFAGQFREFGLVVIIEHEGGYHSVLAGMSKLSVVPEQWVLAGEPIGVLGLNGEDNAGPTLYVELRKEGQAINPLPYLDGAMIDIGIS